MNTEVSARPERPALQLRLDRRRTAEDLLGRDALDHLHDPRRRQNRNRLDQEMHVVAIRADLDEADLIAGGDLQANLPQNTLYCVIENDTPIFGRTDRVIQQNGNIVALVNIRAYASQ